MGVQDEIATLGEPLVRAEGGSPDDLLHAVAIDIPGQAMAVAPAPRKLELSCVSTWGVPEV